MEKFIVVVFAISILFVAYVRVRASKNVKICGVREFIVVGLVVGKNDWSSVF